MHTPSAHTLLETWERGWNQPAPSRAILLLAAACPEPPEILAGWPIGARNRRLLELRKTLFGTALSALADCPNCGERLELGMRSDDLLVGEALSMTHRVALGEYDVGVRLPTGGDLLGLPKTLAAARMAVLERCLVRATCGGVPVAAHDLPDDVVTAIGAALAQADPQASLEIELACPACVHTWSALFDIASFLWRELEAWAGRTLVEVHRLASAYGWSERDILALSPQRRGMYLQMLP